MTFFNIGIKILSIVALLFFLIFGAFCYHWAPIHTRAQRIVIAFMVPFLYICIIFPLGVIAIVIISLILEYLF